MSRLPPTTRSPARRRRRSTPPPPRGSACRASCPCRRDSDRATSRPATSWLSSTGWLSTASANATMRCWGSGTHWPWWRDRSIFGRPARSPCGAIPSVDSARSRRTSSSRRSSASCSESTCRRIRSTAPRRRAFRRPTTSRSPTRRSGSTRSSTMWISSRSTMSRHSGWATRWPGSWTGARCSSSRRTRIRPRSGHRSRRTRARRSSDGGSGSQRSTPRPWPALERRGRTSSCACRASRSWASSCG